MVTYSANTLLIGNPIPSLKFGGLDDKEFNEASEEGLLFALISEDSVGSE